MWAELPAGLASHPRCLTKGSVVRSWLDRAEAQHIECLPDSLREFAERRPLPSDWVPASASRLTWLCLCDQLFPDDDEAAVRWTSEGLEKLASSPLYRALVYLASPRSLFNRSAWRFDAINRGTQLVGELTDGGGRYVWTYPHGAVPRLAAEVAAYGLTIVLRTSRARDPKIALVEYGPTRAELRATWK